MSEQSIYMRLRQAGMTAVGACGLMGNMLAESRMTSNNAQDSYGRNDEQYTAAVDNGTYPGFVTDGIGYGLCQWTHPDRKAKLLRFARSRGVSISDEDMQADFAAHEMRTDFKTLWEFLQENKSVHTAAVRICTDFERPEINNTAIRSSYANEYYMRLGSMEPEIPVALPIEQIRADWPPRELEYGMYGGDVIALQGLLFAHGYHVAVDGDFGNKTGNAVAGFKAEVFGTGDTKCDFKTWDALLKR